MNLYNLKKEIKAINLRIKLINNKIKLLKCKVEPGSVKYSNEIKSKTLIDKTEIIDKIISLKEEKKLLFEELGLYKPYLEELESLLKKHNDTEQQIYYEYYFKGYSVEVIARRYSYSTSHIYYLIKKIDNYLKEKMVKNNKMVCYNIYNGQSPEEM